MATNDDIITKLSELQEVMSAIASSTASVVEELRRANAVNPRITATDGAERRDGEPRPMGVHK